jgi:hypothetical protein
LKRSSFSNVVLPVAATLVMAVAAYGSTDEFLPAGDFFRMLRTAYMSPSAGEVKAAWYEYTGGESLGEEQLADPTRTVGALELQHIRVVWQATSRVLLDRTHPNVRRFSGEMVGEIWQEDYAVRISPDQGTRYEPSFVDFIGREWICAPVALPDVVEDRTASRFHAVRRSDGTIVVSGGSTRTRRQSRFVFDANDLSLLEFESGGSSGARVVSKIVSHQAVPGATFRWPRAVLVNTQGYGVDTMQTLLVVQRPEVSVSVEPAVLQWWSYSPVTYHPDSGMLYGPGDEIRPSVRRSASASSTATERAITRLHREAADSSEVKVIPPARSESAVVLRVAGVVLLVLASALLLRRYVSGAS